MRIIIAGSRTFNDYARLAEVMDKLCVNQSKITVISGTANGADTLGELWARINGHQIERYPADWKRKGRQAGYLRNEEMASVADSLVAFWDGSSPGTSHMIEIAKLRGLKVRVIKI